MPPLGNEFNDVFQEFNDDDPLLGDDDMQFVSDAYEIACEEYSRIAPDKKDCDDELDYTIKLRRIQRIAKLIRASYKSRNDFLEFYPSWRRLRHQNIKVISDAGNSMIKDGRNCNISRIVGASVSFLGGAVVAGGVIAAPFTGGLSLPIAIAGGVAAGTGSATALGSSIAEFALNKKDLNKAQKALDKDKLYYKRMVEWVERSKELVNGIENLIGINLMEEMRKDFKKLVTTYVDIERAISERLKGMIFKAVQKFVKDPKTAVFLNLIPLIISLLYAAFIIRADNKLIFDGIIFTGRLLSGGLIVFDVGIDSVCAGLTLARGGAVVSKSVGRAVAHGTLAALSMAIDVAIIVMASIDIHKGSKSKLSESLLNTAEELQKELNFFEDVYDKVKKGI